MISHGPTMLSIYVICSDKSTKIGISVRPKQRLRDLQASNPHDDLRLAFAAKGEAALIRKAERICHAKLADKRLRNEWFSIREDEGIKAVIDACNEAYGL